MIAYIKGILEYIEEDVIVVDHQGMGYNVHVPLSVLGHLPSVGQTVTLYTAFQVREDAMTLYGFLSRQDLAMFRLLIGVNGIGPKGALGILSAFSTDDLRMAVISGDAKTISKAPGVGAKTAQRMILDLKDKIQIEDVLDTAAQEIQTEASVKDAGKEAIQALVSLGYSSMEAAKAVRRVTISDDMGADDVLKAALRFLAF